MYNEYFLPVCSLPFNFLDDFRKTDGFFLMKIIFVNFFFYG